MSSSTGRRSRVRASQPSMLCCAVLYAAITDGISFARSFLLLHLFTIHVVSDAGAEQVSTTCWMTRR